MKLDSGSIPGLSHFLTSLPRCKQSFSAASARAAMVGSTLLESVRIIVNSILPDIVISHNLHFLQQRARAGWHATEVVTEECFERIDHTQSRECSTRS